MSIDDLTIRQARDKMFANPVIKCACGCGRPVPDEEAPDEDSPGHVEDDDGALYASWACFNAVGPAAQDDDPCSQCGEVECICAGGEADLEHDDFPMELEYEDPADDFPAGDGDDWD